MRNTKAKQIKRLVRDAMFIPKKGTRFAFTKAEKQTIYADRKFKSIYRRRKKNVVRDKIS